MKREYDIEINIKKLMFSNNEHHCTCGKALCNYLYIDEDNKSYIEECKEKGEKGNIEFYYRYLVYTHLQKLFPKEEPYPLGLNVLPYTLVHIQSVYIVIGPLNKLFLIR